MELCFSFLPCFQFPPKLAQTNSEERSDWRGKYKLLADLGKGDFGSVMLAEHVDTKERFALKEFFARKMDQADINREVRMLRICEHPNIVRLHDVICSGGSSCMIMELVEGGNLLAHVKQRQRLLEDEARKLFRELANTVSYLHARGIAHRDLKLENLLLSSTYQLKIADFGLAREMVNGYVLGIPMGSPNYAAPEILQGNINKYLGAPADMYSCGIVLYTFLCGKFPYGGNYEQILKGTKKGKFKIPDHMSITAETLVRKFLTQSPDSRISMEQLDADEWFKQGMTDSPVLLGRRLTDEKCDVSKKLGAR